VRRNKGIIIMCKVIKRTVTHTLARRIAHQKFQSIIFDISLSPKGSFTTRHKRRSIAQHKVIQNAMERTAQKTYILETELPMRLLEK
jgi:hypothetical protein